MQKSNFVYVPYISTTPEKVWNALIDAEMTKQYWVRHRNVSDWRPGSAWRHEDYDDPAKVDLVGEVVEATPPRRLVLTCAFAADAQDQAKHSRVAIDIEPFLDAVRVTVTHEELEPDSEMLRGIRFAGPPPC